MPGFAVKTARCPATNESDVHVRAGSRVAAPAPIHEPPWKDFMQTFNHSSDELPNWRARTVALSLILGAAALRIIYFGWFGSLDLSPDEAHYWDWSRHLDWSYYSKGPLVAWLIRASCGVFGETMPAVRLPAVLCGALTLWGLYQLTWQVYHSGGLALGVVVMALTLPDRKSVV